MYLLSVVMLAGCTGQAMPVALSPGPGTASPEVSVGAPPTPALAVASPTAASLKPSETVPPVVSPGAVAATTPAVWDVYNPNPEHLWNRLLRALHSRIAASV